MANGAAAIGECIKQQNVKLFLRFAPERSGKRMLNKLVGGLMTTGMEPLPITPYEGLTGRRNLKEQATETAKNTAALTGSAAEINTEVDSPGNVNRGDWTPIELFMRGAFGLSASVQRLIAAA